MIDMTLNNKQNMTFMINIYNIINMVMLINSIKIFKQ